MEGTICDVPECPLYSTDTQKGQLVEVELPSNQIGFIPGKCWRCSEVCVACRYHPALSKDHSFLKEEGSSPFLKNESHCALFCL